MKFIKDGDALIVLDCILAVWLGGSSIQQYFHTVWGFWTWLGYLLFLVVAAVVVIICVLFYFFLKEEQVSPEYPYQIPYR